MQRLVWLMCWALLVGCGGQEPSQQPPAQGPPCELLANHPQDDALRLNHLQAKSTHNSYHLEVDGNDIAAVAFSMPPLDEQLGQHGVRHFELDIRYNAELGRTEVFHLPLIDAETNCATLVGCLETLKTWSLAHRGHHPIMVHIEPKDPLPADFEAYVSGLHVEITSVWHPSCIVTPDQVQEGHASLAEAIVQSGWPTLGASRGKILLTMLDRGAWRDAYTYEGTNLEGRLMFAEGAPSEPFAAVTRVDQPIDGAASIEAALAVNMLVRTRADNGSVEALAEDTTRLEAALASGAHLVSTDYPAKVSEHDYWLEIPGGTPSRCNPVTAPASCASTDIEDPSLLSP